MAKLDLSDAGFERRRRELDATFSEFQYQPTFGPSEGPVVTGAQGRATGRKYTDYLFDLLRQQNDLLVMLDERLGKLEKRCG